MFAYKIVYIECLPEREETKLKLVQLWEIRENLKFGYLQKGMSQTDVVDNDKLTVTPNFLHVKETTEIAGINFNERIASVVSIYNTFTYSDVVEKIHRSNSNN